MTVTCPGSSPVNVPNGANGAACTVANIDGGVTVTCPGSAPVTVLNGTSIAGRAPVEQCLICHGPGAIAPITLMHNGEKTFNPIAGLKISVTAVSSTEPITVNFKVTDDRGNPVDLAGLYSINTPIAPRFSLSRIETVANPDGGTAIMLPYKVLSRTGSKTGDATDAGAVSDVYTNPNTFTPTFPPPLSADAGIEAAMKGLLVEVGTGLGTYAYTFPTGGDTFTDNSSGKKVRTVTEPVTYGGDLTSSYTVWMQSSRQWDLVFTSNLQTFKAVDTEYNFIPNGGTALKRRIVSQDACDKCHDHFKRDLNPNLTLPSVNGFHSGGRVESPFCNVCHNQAAVLSDGGQNTPKFSSSFVHRVHGSSKLVANPDGGIPVNSWTGIQIDYPQDIRGCDVCHGSAQAVNGWQAVYLPSRAACGSCHDGVDFAASSLATCTNPSAVDAKGRFIPCKHVGGPQASDANCTLCHGDATAVSPIVGRHLAVLPPDPKAQQSGALADGGWGLPDGGAGTASTNAGWIAAANDVPPGASKFTYDVLEVKVVAGKLTMVFKMKQSIDGSTPVDVDFGTYNSSTNKELIPGFVGGPSAYFWFATPQDGIVAPADFNASANCYLKNAWNGSATTGTSACTLSARGVGGTGYYTLTMTNVVIPASAKMLTGGLGYGYSIATARPMTQTNLAAYPYSTTTGIGGLLVPTPNVWKVATGFTARRAIVETARCNNCHSQLGVGPTFHAGQRNDAQSCTVCHNPNRTSSGWAANEKDFIHSIHGGRIRTVPFNWHAISESENFAEVEFPSDINNCEACHLPGTYDFTLKSTVDALPNMLVSTAATGKLNRDPVTNPTSWFAIAPANYVLADNVYSYGTGYSYNTADAGITEAAATTLVKTPITAACSACHDAAPSISHMRSMGGAFYQPRSEVFVK